VSEYCIPDCQEIWEFIYPSYEACIADCIDFFDDEIDIQNIYSCTCPYDDSDAGWDAGDAACQVYGDDFYFDPYSCTCYEDFECEVLCGELTAPTFSFGHNR
jgi:hypothetical protein